MKDGDVIQVAHVVNDLDAAMKYFWETFHIGPWIFTPLGLQTSEILW